MGKIKGSNLSVKIDWISFCIDESDFMKALDYLKLDYEEFKDLRHGGRGYRNMLQHNVYDINVYFDGTNDMGTHFEIKGSAVAFFIDIIMIRKFKFENPFEEAEGVEWDLSAVSTVFRLILERGWFNRIDIAIDDVGTKFFTCKRLYELLEDRCYVAKFKRYDQFVTKDASGNCTGHTVYLGSRESSDMFIRVYDKYLEQLKTHTDLACDSWVRWEIVIKNEKADIFAGYICDGLEFGCCLRAVLNGYMRLIKLDDVNRSRCSTLPKWQKFVDTVNSIYLSVPREMRSVEKARNWIDRQVMPTMAGLVRAYGGDMSFFYEHLEEHYDRLSASDQKMFENFGGGR